MALPVSDSKSTNSNAKNSAALNTQDDSLITRLLPCKYFNQFIASLWELIVTFPNSFREKRRPGKSGG